MLQPPFIVVDKSTDLYFYRAIEDVSRDLEAVDVRNGEYRFYDCNACPAELGVEPTIVLRLPAFLGGGLPGEYVKVGPSSAPPEPLELICALNRALDNLPEELPEPRPSTLPELINLTISKYGYSP